MRAGFSALLISLAVLGCATWRQQKSQPARPDDLHFHNLQIFPQNIEREELINKMKSYNRALGVKCDYCHVQTATTPEPQFDFPSDEKSAKHAARIMIRMTNDMNRNYLPKIEEMYTTIACWTCHRGERRPDVAPAPSAPATP